MIVVLFGIKVYNKTLFLSFRPRWVVPVLPKGELEVLLEAAIDLCKKGTNICACVVIYVVSWDVMVQLNEIDCLLINTQ